MSVGSVEYPRSTAKDRHSGSTLYISHSMANFSTSTYAVRSTRSLTRPVPAPRIRRRNKAHPYLPSALTVRRSGIRCYASNIAPLFLRACTDLVSVIAVRLSAPQREDVVVAVQRALHKPRTAALQRCVAAAGKRGNGAQSRSHQNEDNLTNKASDKELCHHTQTAWRLRQPRIITNQSSVPTFQVATPSRSAASAAATSISESSSQSPSMNASPSNALPPQARSSASRAKCPPATGLAIKRIGEKSPCPSVSYRSVNGRSEECQLPAAPSHQFLSSKSDDVPVTVSLTQRATFSITASRVLLLATADAKNSQSLFA